jgi:phosphoribosylglycinamide formyltransferase-1
VTDASNMSDEKLKFGVLASGRGSNFAALLQQQSEGYFERAELVCLVSNKPEAPALELAREAGLRSYGLLPREYGTAEAYENEILRLMEENQVQWLLLAGYMKIIGPAILQHYQGRIINIHPSLLPSFPGLNAQRQALEHGVRVSGCTVHFVDEGLDSGPIIGQRSVPVFPEDTEDDLSARILVQEHELFSTCVKAITERPWKIDGRRVVFLDDLEEFP